MNATELTALLPLLLIAATPVVVMLAVICKRSHSLTLWLSLLGLAAAFWSLWPAAGVVPVHVTRLLIVDRYSLFFMGLIFAATFAVALLSFEYLRQIEGPYEEFYIVLLLATLGACVMVSSDHFATFFLGLEILTVSLYAMIAYVRSGDRPLEAGLKYLVLAAVSSAFLLFGMALIYAELGTMEFSKIATQLAVTPGHRDLFLLVGLGFMTVAIGFKLAVVPFHMWTADVYEGAPAPVTAYVATVSKGAMFALLLRYFFEIGGYNYGPVVAVFGFIAIVSMFVGNLLALLQSNVKRILAYSSIAHLGYMLVAFVAGGSEGVQAITFYLVAYFVTTLGAFGVVSLLSRGGEEKDAIDDYRGLFWTRPWIAAVFTGMLLSLAGIPLTAGFIGKYFVLVAGVGAAQWVLVVLLVVNSTIGLFYYLRIVVAMLGDPAAQRASYGKVAFGGGVVLAALMLGLVWLGVYPAPLLEAIRTAVAVF